jgi:polygalacturonase
MSIIQTFQHPKSCALSHNFELEVAGHSIEVLETGVADFANFVYDVNEGPAEVVITSNLPIKNFNIRPLQKNIAGKIQGNSLKFTLHAAEKLCIEINNGRPLYLWANPPELDVPAPNDPKVHYFKAGQVYEFENLGMQSGETIYIEGGAVLKGRIHVKNANDITIRGYGIFDGSYYKRERGDHIPSILLEKCNNVVVRDITMIYPSGWMLVPAACEDVEIFNLKQIGEVVSSDGIDILGSKRVHIHHCFLNNNDDCVVVKAFFLGSKNSTATNVDGRVSPEDILVENCTLANAPAGNAMEIGHELSVETVSNVIFRNIDVLSVHGQGAVFSIHNNDRALIKDILFEDIRIEHCWDKFIDFRISLSRYSTDEERGSIRNVTLRNINWHRPDINLGYTISMIGGWDENHTIENIFFENVCINGKPIQHLNELEICTRHAKNIQLIQN